MTEDEDDNGGDEDDGILMPHASAYPKATIGGIRIDVRALLHIDPENLIHDYRTIHHWIATVNYRVGLMQVTLTRKKRELQRLEATLTRHYRSTTEKKITESQLKSCIILDAKYQELQDEVDALDHTKNTYMIILTALENKQSLVINMGAEIRKRRANPLD